MEQAILRISIFLLLAAVVLFLIFGKTKTVEQKYKKGKERQFQVAHAEGEIEQTVQSGNIKVRIDDLTNKHAIEYDFTKKWAEALGQALRFSRLTHRRGGIVFILGKESDMEYVRESVKDIKRFNLPVDVWTVQNLKDKKVEIKI